MYRVKSQDKEFEMFNRVVKSKAKAQRIAGIWQFSGIKKVIAFDIPTGKRVW